MGTSKVSIIVTVFKRTEYLAIALQSALNQSFQDYEIVVTDDSGSDAIRAICTSFKSEKIRYRKNEGNLGVALNVRAAVAEAKGTYAAILNDDDVWETEFLSKLVEALDQDQRRVLAFCDHWIIGPEGFVDVAETDANTARYGRAELPAGEVADLANLVLLKNGVPLAMGAVFRIDAIDWNRVVKEVSGAYDYWISCLLAASGGRAYYVPERLTRYRLHGAMETGRQAPDKNENQVYINRELLEGNIFPAYREVLKQGYAFALYVVGKDNVAFDRQRQARRYLVRSMKTVFDKRALVYWCLTYVPRRLRSIVLGRRSTLSRIGL